MEGPISRQSLCVVVRHWATASLPHRTLVRAALSALDFVARFAVLGLALAFIVILLKPSLADRLRSGMADTAVPESQAVPAASVAPVVPPATVVPGDDKPGVGQGDVVSYSQAVRRAAPSVVSIYADKVVTERPVRLLPDAALQRFSGISIGKPRRRLERALGSGVVVTEDGFVLTNHHVIRDASNIHIVLPDGRVTAARVIGSDPETDLAVLKVDGDELPTMPLDVDMEPQVGDVVLAIGNPFGLGQTVTQGIVSALGRNELNLTTFEDFIQTDAAINEGNSGGALIDARGRLIGINTFVLGRLRAGAEGISFAIPRRTAQAVFEQIVAHGSVTRGWLGAEYSAVNHVPGTAGLTQPGVELAAVYEAGPAALAGLRPGDVLLRFDGESIAGESALRDREAGLAPGTTTRIEGLRAGVPFNVEIVLGRRPNVPAT